MLYIFLNWYLVKKHLIHIVILGFLLWSCSQESTSKTSSPEETKKTQEDFVVYKDTKACGIITCALREHLESEAEKWSFDLDKTNYFQKRFSAILSRYSKKDVLVKTQEFQKLVDDFYKEYFSQKTQYSYDEKNYVWYIFLPKMVTDEYINKWLSTDNWDIESIVQAIKERYYGTYYEKQVVIEWYKNDLKEKIAKIDLSQIDKEKLKTDDAYFHQVILTPGSGIYDKITSGIVDIIWPEKWQMKEVVVFTTDQFFEVLKTLWMSREDFYKKIGTVQDNFKNSNKKVQEIEKKYWISKVVPSDRYIRHEEIVKYVFNNLAEFNKYWDFNKDILEVKHYNLLQYSYPDESLYNMNLRVAQYNFENNFMVENLFKYSKTLDENTGL